MCGKWERLTRHNSTTTALNANMQSPLFNNKMCFHIGGSHRFRIRPNSRNTSRTVSFFCGEHENVSFFPVSERVSSARLLLVVLFDTTLDPGGFWPNDSSKDLVSVVLGVPVMIPTVLAVPTVVLVVPTVVLVVPVVSTVLLVVLAVRAVPPPPVPSFFRASIMKCPRYAVRNRAKHQNASLSSGTISRNLAATSFMPWQYPTCLSCRQYAVRTF